MSVSGTQGSEDTVLATDPELCDPAKAVELAERAVKASGAPGPELLDTLARARAAACR